MKNKKSVIIVIMLFSCFSCSNETYLKSNTIVDKTERIIILSKEVTLLSEIQNAEFDLFNQNGFSDDFVSLPGSSESQYLFAIKVNPTTTENWKEGLTEIKGELKNEQWISDLTKTRPNEWIVNSVPKFYTRKDEKGVSIVLFEKEGIIFKRILQE